MCGDCCGGSKKKKEDGPQRKPPMSRNNVCCTDIIILVLFVAFLGLMMYMAVYSILRGDALRLVFGYDSFGNTCNKDNRGNPIINLTNSGRDTSGMENVFFHSMLDPFDAMQVCVSKCPDKDLKTKADVKKFAEETGSRLCRYDIPIEDYEEQEFRKEGPCPSLPIFKSAVLIYRCAPDPFVFVGDALLSEERKNATKAFYAIFGFDDIFRKVLSDFYTSWREIIVLCAVAVVISFVMVLLIRFLASVIVWLIIILAAVGSIAGTAFLWWTFYQIKQKQDNNDKLDIPIIGIEIDNELAFLIFSIIATVLTVLLLLILLIMRKRISLVVALFHEAGKALASMPLLLVQPIWTFLILAAFLVYWVIVLAFISTTGYPTADNEKGFSSVKYELEGVAKHFWWIHLIGLIWIAEFILACQQFVIAGATANWYFSRDNKVSCPIGKSICRLILHHIGSVAFGSLIILIVKIPRYILMYIQAKTEGSENCCAKCCIKCCICCLWCLEKILKFLNQNAYTIIAIDGKSFCPAAKKAFSILTSNVLRVAAINSVGAFVLFLGKIGVMAATCAVSVVWLRSLPQVHYFAVPVLLLCIFSFLIAHCFLSVYEMVIDALLLCFCEDTAMNDGVSEGKEYYMNASLMEYVKTSSKQLDTIKGRKKDYVDATTEEGRELKEMNA